MNELEQMFEHYTEYKSTNGMLILEMLEYKKLNMSDLFPILGSTSVLLEYINGKRQLSSKQIEKLAELFGVIPDVFKRDEKLDQGISQAANFAEQSFKDENSQEHAERESNFMSPFSQQENSFQDERFTQNFDENNEFKPQNFQAKPFWED